MVTSNDIGVRWAGLASAGEAERGQQMRAILDEVLALDEGARVEVVRRMVEAEYALTDEQLRPFTVSRLRSWLAIADSDLASAQAIARGYDAAFEQMPGAAAMRRSTTVQTVARTTLSAAEIQGLFALIPSIVQQIPRAVPSAHTQRKEDAPEAKKPFWKFW
ncbi:MAG: hypothetical protein O2798_07320 [Chloroflexi bacterium]|nr:hypothetical protein [Chloroflexota bacterium]